MVLAVDKPLHWTSFDVVKKLRARWQLRKVGHAGTLDPLATGLLIICTGKATKSIDQYQAMEKVYQGTLVLGKTTPSIDLETPFDSTTPWGHLQEQDLLGQVPSFTGNLLQ
ncbi:MAG: tRNA pseudouridine(55) synthase, partial [Bacteroidota bacterium]